MTYYRLFQLIDSELRRGKTLRSCKNHLTNNSSRNQFFNVPYLNPILNNEKTYTISNEYGYKRIPLYKSHLAEMHIIKWGLKSKSPVHEHPELGCLMKIISGELYENQYHFISRHEKNEPSLMEIKRNVLKEHDTHFIEGTTIYHKITNNNLDKETISLHIYAPPYENV